MESTNDIKNWLKKVNITPWQARQVWYTFTSFSVVTDKDGDKLKLFSCDKCAKVVLSVKRNSHSQINHFFPHTINKTQQRNMRLCCRDIWPYVFVTWKAFADLVQHLVNVAANYSKFDVKHVLPHPATVSRHVEGKAQALL